MLSIHDNFFLVIGDILIGALPGSKVLLNDVSWSARGGISYPLNTTTGTLQDRLSAFVLFIFFNPTIFSGLTLLPTT